MRLYGSPNDGSSGRSLQMVVVDSMKAVDLFDNVPMLCTEPFPYSQSVNCANRLVGGLLFKSWGLRLGWLIVLGLGFRVWFRFRFGWRQLREPQIQRFMNAVA